MSSEEKPAMMIELFGHVSVSFGGGEDTFTGISQIEKHSVCVFEVMCFRKLGHICVRIVYINDTFAKVCHSLARNLQIDWIAING